MIATPALDRIEQMLQKLLSGDTAGYHVPGIWIGEHGDCQMSSGTSFFLRQIASIRACSVNPIRMPLVYNGLVRHVTSYDHGKAAVEIGWRTTGTFLKFISLLPYLHSIGTTHILLLPISRRGSAGRKGALGSPYAVANPFMIDPELDEPRLDIPVEIQARAFVEACHSMGMKVVTEVVLRTASVDSSFVEHHPEWFYWISDKEHELPFSAPIFDDHTLSVIRSQIGRGSRYRLPEPSIDYRDRFSSVPASLVCDEGGWRGVCLDGMPVRIPGAFADWPPDDPQPAWSDVTYFKLHSHPDFNYMAYNTLRMFDERLEADHYQQHGLWNEIAQFIPYMQETLGVDGCMIDMGHALPQALRSRVMNRARAHTHDFAIWEECFELEEELAHQGVNCVTGYLPLSALDMNLLSSYTVRCSKKDLPISYFGAVESHNTPRAHTRASSSMVFAVWLYLSILPRSLPFVLSGFELGETMPMNTGLGFTPEELEAYIDAPLPLFDDVRLPWSRFSEIPERLRQRAASIRETDVYAHLTDADDVVVLTASENVLAYVRIPEGERRGLLVVLNASKDNSIVSLPCSEVVDAAVHERVHRTSGNVHVHLSAEECVILPVLLSLSGRIYRERRVDATLTRVT